MKLDVVLGLQWGDEGKGKIVDVLAGNYPVVARFQGGPNAGHSLHFEGKSFVLRSIPSGIFRKDAKNIIGNGVVLDPITFRKECENIEATGVPVKERITVAKKAHLILPTHRLLDAANEAAMGKGKIGSTLKGIGPTYTDKVSRNGLRVGDVLAPDFADRFRKLKERHVRMLSQMQFECNPEAEEAEFFAAVEYLKQFRLTDCEYYVEGFLHLRGKFDSYSSLSGSGSVVPGGSINVSGTLGSFVANDTQVVYDSTLMCVPTDPWRYIDPPSKWAVIFLGGDVNMPRVLCRLPDT